MFAGMKRPLLLLVACLFALLSNAAETPLMRDFIGVNGHTVQFKPELYRPVCGLVRDYHPAEWDLGNDSTKLPPFPAAKNGVDWSQVYGAWRAQHWTIDVSLMFESVPRANWKNMETDAKAYGKAFARQFGPSNSRPLVDSIEIGNEPGKWSDTDYTRMFKAMAEGIRSGDPKLKIATCNLTTGKSGDYDKSVECVAKFPELFDVLNVHTYAQLEGWPTWKRSFPEDPRLPHYLQDVTALCKWRDAHASGKPVWITEFGYDSTTKPQPTSGTFSKWIGVTDTQQAQWLVRSLLVFSTMPVQRAYLYFFNDNDEPHVHGSSGITRNFVPKPSFYALSQLQRLLGDCRFTRIVTNEQGKLRVQEYRSDAQKIVWLAWSPTGEEKSLDAMLTTTPGRLLKAEKMMLSASAPSAPEVRQGPNGNLQATVDESPLYLVFQPR